MDPIYPKQIFGLFMGTFVSEVVPLHCAYFQVQTTCFAYFPTIYDAQQVLCKNHLQMCWQVVSILTFSPTSASMNAFRLFLLKSAPLIEIVCSFQIQFVQEWSLIKCDTKSKHLFSINFLIVKHKESLLQSLPGTQNDHMMEKRRKIYDIILPNNNPNIHFGL